MAGVSTEVADAVGVGWAEEVGSAVAVGWAVDVGSASAVGWAVELAEAAGVGRTVVVGGIAGEGLAAGATHAPVMTSAITNVSAGTALPEGAGRLVTCDLDMRR